MFPHSCKPAAAFILAAFLSAATIVAGQDRQPVLKITRPSSEKALVQRKTSKAQLDRESVFHRLHPAELVSNEKVRKRQRTAATGLSPLTRTSPAPSALQLLSIGTGGGDANEVEPNNPAAQAVALPVNVFGEISVIRDVDFFTFQAAAGQQITIEPFAARLRRSNLVAEIAIFDSAGVLIDVETGNEVNDPLIRFTSAIDQVLIAGIADADELGGSSFDYILNITSGNDIDEQEPNDSNAQAIGELPSTIFGEIDFIDDVDFFSFTATAGQTLIVDVDAEVFGSRLDAEINLTDPTTGVEFFYSDQLDGDDPRFNIVLPYSGRYVIGIGAFDSNSSGFYRLNASLVSGAGAPVVTSVSPLAKKLIEVSGEGFRSGSILEVNGVARKTTVIDSQTLRAKVKAKPGNVLTVTNPPDGRRSNPLSMP